MPTRPTERPLSPIHIYAPQLTSVLSITHRGTGVLLSFGTLGLAYWLLAIASSADVYAILQQHMAAWYGQCLLLALMFSFYYHLCNGIRHLCWDMILGLDLKSTYISGYTVIIVASLLTLFSYLFGMGGV